MGLNIEFTKGVELEHINLRREGPEDEKDKAVDLKLSGLAPADAELVGILTGYSGSNWQMFWQMFPPEDRDPELIEDYVPETIIPGIDKMQSFAVFEGDHRMKLGGMEFRPKVVKKFVLKISPGPALDITFSASIIGITDRELAILAEMLGESMPCEIIYDPMQQDMLEDIGRDSESPGDLDIAYREAVKLVVSEQRASVSIIQRHLRIGYNRAAMIVEAMERNGIVSEPDRQGTRAVLQQ